MDLRQAANIACACAHGTLGRRKRDLLFRLIEDSQEVWDDWCMTWVLSDLEDVAIALRAIRDNASAIANLRAIILLRQVERFVTAYATSVITECHDGDAVAAAGEEPWVFRMMRTHGWKPMDQVETWARVGPAPFTVGIIVDDWRAAMSRTERRAMAR